MRQVILALVVVVLMLGYDEITAAGVTPPEKAVAERVVQRWDALIGQDFNRAYEFETPGFRETNPIGRYRSFYGNAVKWENAEVGNVEFSADRQSAKVSVILDYEGPKPGGGVYQGQRSVMEAWLWMDGNWWYVRNMKGLR